MASRSMTNPAGCAPADRLPRTLTPTLRQTEDTEHLIQVLGKKCGFCAGLKSGAAAGVDPGTCGAFDCTQMKRRRVEKHGSLAREGEKMMYLYSLRFGQIKVIGREHDEYQVTGFHMPGDLIGLESIGAGRHRFRLLALENCEVCEIPVAALPGLVAQQPGFQETLLYSFSVALDEAYKRASILSMHSLERRFAEFLLGLSRKYARMGYSRNSFRLLMTRGDIGSYLATSIESVSRLISRFNSRGATLIQGRTVDIINRPFLEALAGGHGEFDIGVGMPPAPAMA